MYSKRYFPFFIANLITLLLCLSYAVAQDTTDGNISYRFDLLYYHDDGTTHEQAHYLKEKDFSTFYYPSLEFRGIRGSAFEDTTKLFGKLSTPAGLGIWFASRKSAFFGYPVRVFSRNYPSYNVMDSSPVSIIALGINPNNTDQYQYRLVLNDSTTLKDWTDVTVFKRVSETGYQYAVIGDFAFNKAYLLVETRNKKTHINAGSMIINWPKQPGLSLSGTRVYFKENNFMGVNGYLDASLLDKRYAVGKDSTTGVLQQLRLPGNKEYRDLIFDFRKIEFTFPYKAVLERNRSGKTDTMEVNFYFNESSVRINNDLVDQPGKYRLLVGNTYFFESPQFNKWILEVPFELLPRPILSEKWSLKQLLPYVSAILIIVLIIFLSYYKINQGRLKKLEQTKQLKHLQLRNLQHQLNPHFLFNALNAIQNLVSKGDVQGASHYLSSFSSLTRSILETSGQELISLEEELFRLRSYVEMEQLRIPFRYNIDVEESINKANIEIPIMLLQPFVENAVKHGVNPLKQKGLIEIFVQNAAGSLCFIIKDNGSGMVKKLPGADTTGMGLNLISRRVQLLNEMYGSEIVTYVINSGNDGTSVVLTLKDWLL